MPPTLFSSRSPVLWAATASSGLLLGLVLSSCSSASSGTAPAAAPAAPAVAAPGAATGAAPSAAPPILAAALGFYGTDGALWLIFAAASLSFVAMILLASRASPVK